MSDKRYLTDGVYVEVERGMLRVSTGDDAHVIWLECQTMDLLVEYYEEQKAKRGS